MPSKTYTSNGRPRVDRAQYLPTPAQIEDGCRLARLARTEPPVEDPTEDDEGDEDDYDVRKRGS